MIGSSGCHLLFHPSGDLLLISDDRPRTQLDLLWEGPVVDAVIDEGLAHPRDLKDLWEAKEAGCCGLSWHHSSSFRSSAKQNSI